jgi:hypothetical protein
VACLALTREGYRELVRFARAACVLDKRKVIANAVRLLVGWFEQNVWCVTALAVMCRRFSLMEMVV